MNQSLMSVTPISIDVSTTDGKLSIQWADGHAHQFTLFGLRKNCPCVMCRGGHELMDQFEPGFFLVDPSEAPGGSTLSIQKILPIGHHAIRIYWSDGHNDGMYRYENLRYWGEWIENKQSAG